MKITDTVPQFWYLLEDDEGLVLTINCENSFVSYDFTMRLKPEEVAAYRREGKAYLNGLAEAVNYSCPIARGSTSPYKERNIDAQYSAAISEAVQHWKQADHEH